jgi:hypothetical protein
MPAPTSDKEPKPLIWLWTLGFFVALLVFLAVRALVS